MKQRLLRRSDHRITRDGVVIIKGQQHRSLEMNRAEALERLQALVDSAGRAEAAQAHAADARVEAAPPGEQGQARRIKALRGKVVD